MSLLSDYEQRTTWKYERISGSFPTHDGLANKVRPDGSYVPFFGSTVVFTADDQCIRTLQKTQMFLHDRLGEMLAEPLPASTLHLTLHDLVSPELCVSDPGDVESYSREVAASVSKAEKIVREIKSEYPRQRIVFDADRIVNMAAKSLVLQLRPHSEKDYDLLLEMYRRFDDIVSLPYELTPHITLAYFRPGMIDGDRLGSVVEQIQIPGNDTCLFDFPVEALTVQVFRNMKTYE